MANNDINFNYEYPSLREYYSNITPILALILLVAFLLVLTNILIFCTTAMRFKKNLDAPFLWRSMMLISFYSIISCAAFVTLLVPKSWLICHTIMHLSFTVGAVIFRDLLFLYIGHEEQYLMEHSNEPISINTPPICCCCSFLSAFYPNKTNFFIIRCMILQMPLVQGSIMLLINTIYYKNPEIYADVVLYFTSFIVCSILIGLWALNIIVRMVSSILAEHRILRKLFSLQLILIFCKLQYLILDNLLDNFNFETVSNIDHKIVKQSIINILILCEMILVSLLARSAYKVSLKTMENESLDTSL